MRAVTSFLLAGFLFVAYTVQAQSARFFPDAVIIKYESPNTAQKANPDYLLHARQKVTDLANGVGNAQITPLWNEGYETPLKARLKAKSIFTEDISDELKSIYRISFDTPINPEILARKLASIPGVEYAEPQFIRTIHEAPNDPITNTYQNYHKFNEAWDISKGSNNVVIAVIDGGVNYNHEDLDAKQWINPNEVPENGIDDDGNGFVDDVLGWDFWESGSLFSAVETDNNPIAEFSDHGTHVAGIAAAETNNGIGLAGTGYNSYYMAVKTGGTADDPRSIGFGYDGILYAAIMGADIINCSFGGAGYSETEQYVINFVTDLGALVVASAGNNGTDILNFPAAYDNVLSIGSVETTGQRASYSNFGYTVDVMATGSNIRSAAGFTNDFYENKQGTSMSSPVVSGLAALIKSQHPDWSARRIGTQIRASAFSLGDTYLFGNGAVDAEAALSAPLPGLVITNYEVTGVGDAPLKLGAPGEVTLSITNYGESTSNLVIDLAPAQQNISITGGTSFDIGSLATEDTLSLSFQFTIAENYDLSDIPGFILTFSDNSFGYEDFGTVIIDGLNYGVMQANNLTMSFSGDGTIGFTSASGGSGGIGFIPGDLNNVLFEGGIIVTADDSLVNNTVREFTGYDKDFTPLDYFGVDVPGQLSDQDGTGAFYANEEGDFTGLDITLNTYAFDEAGIENVVFSQYEIENTSGQNRTNVHFGIFVDWDINEYANNSADYDAQNDFMYAYDDTEGNDYPFIAIVPMQTASSNLAINNDFSGTETDFHFSIYDGYSDKEKLNSMLAGNQASSVSNTDISVVTASGPYVLGPNSPISLGFFYAFGSTLSELQAQVAAARAKAPFDVDAPGTYIPNEFEAELPDEVRLNQNYPNPFNPNTVISYQLPISSNVQLTVFDLTGREVAQLVQGEQQAGTHSVNFDARTLSSGVYLAVLKTNSVTQTIKLTLIK